MGRMNGRILSGLALAVFLVMALAACDQLPMMDTVNATIRASQDTATPVPGNSGNLLMFAPSLSGFSLSWTEATDATCSQADLTYKVVLSTVLNNATVQEAEIVGGGRIVFKDWSPYSGTVMITGLTVRQYFVAVLVKDKAGNKAIYNTHDGPPSMELRDGAGAIISSAGVVQYGSFTGIVPIQFTIRNNGFGLLFLTNSPPGYVTVNNVIGSVFSVQSQPPTSVVIPGSTVNFTVQAASDGGGHRAAEVTLPNNDPDKITFTFGVDASDCH